MPTLTAELSGIDDTLIGELSVYTGSLSKTQFEEMWDRVEERLNSDLVPSFSVIDDKLNFTSVNPVENRVVAIALDNVYRLFPTTTINGDSDNRTIIIEDGANGVPLDNLIIEIPPEQNGSGVPSVSNPRTFKVINTIPMISVMRYDEDGNLFDMRNEIYSFGSVNRPNMRAGKIDFKVGVIYVYAYYPDYTGEDEIIGPWVSSLGEYVPDTDPPIGSQVVDLGRVEREFVLSEYAKERLTRYGTTSGRCVYEIRANGNFSLTYRADPKAYTDLAVGLTAIQRQALIGLLDD